MIVLEPGGERPGKILDLAHKAVLYSSQRGAVFLYFAVFQMCLCNIASKNSTALRDIFCRCITRCDKSEPCGVSVCVAVNTDVCT